MNLITVNGNHYDADQFSPEGQRLVRLITEAQSEMARLETKQMLLNAAQQQLVQQLKPLLPQMVSDKASSGNVEILGEASDQIPTTSVEKPDKEPSPLPDAMPDSVRSKL